MKRFIALLTTLLLLAALSGVTAYAEGETEGYFGDGDALHWVLSGGTLTVSGTGAIPDYASADETPWHEHNTAIAAVVIDYDITAIGSNAFSGTNADSLTVADSVTAIAAGAFSAATFSSIWIPCTLAGNANLPAAALTVILHAPTLVPEIAATNAAAGQKLHYVCADCSSKFWDEACTNPVLNDEELVIAIVDILWTFEPATGTLLIYGGDTVTDYPSIDGTPWAAHKDSIKNVAIYSGIKSVGKNALPSKVEELTIPCALAGSSNLPGADAVELIHDYGNAVHVSEIPATYTTTGTKEHWVCTCGQRFWDADCTNPVKNESELIIPKTDNTPPTPSDISLTYTQISLQSMDMYDTVNVLAVDNESGVKNGAISFVNITSGSENVISCDLNFSGTLTGTLKFPLSASSGTYRISSLTLCDNAGNSYTYGYSELPAKFMNTSVIVSRQTKLTPVLSVSFENTSVGYGGTLKGKVLMTVNATPLANKTVSIYSGSTLEQTVNTGADGTAEFSLYKKTAGSYQVKATFAGDSDFNSCYSNPVTVTFTTVPATGDSYNVLLWSIVVFMALGVNAWFVINRKRV